MEEHITFPVGDDDDAIVLEGLFSTPGAPTIGAVLCHPHPLYGGEMRNNVVSALANSFQEENIATLRFNFRGVGQSQGKHDEGVAECDDVKAAVTALLDRQAGGHMDPGFRLPCRCFFDIALHGLPRVVVDSNGVLGR